MEIAIKPSKLGSTYGTLFGFIMVLIFILQQFIPAITPTTLIIVDIVTLLIGLIMVPIVVKKQNNGFMSFGQGLGSTGMLILVSTIISGVFIYFYIKFVDDFYLESLKETRVEKLTAQMPEEQARQLIKNSSQLFSAEIVTVQMVLSKLVIGFVLTLIIVAVLKKRKKDDSLNR